MPRGSAGPRAGLTGPAAGTVDPAGASGRDLARTLSPLRRRGAGRLDPALDALGRRLVRIYRSFQGSPDLPSLYPRVSEWLLDNEYLTRGALRQAREAIPPGHYRKLRKVAVRTDGGPDDEAVAGTAGGELVVGTLAAAYLAEVDHLLDEESLAGFVAGFQSVHPLNMGELWALPAMLRVVALERIVDVCEPIIEGDPAPSEPTPDAVAGEALRPAERVGACVESLRLADELDWRRFFEAVSRVEEILRRDPSRTYGRMDFDTRDRYRKAVEEVAEASDASEWEVAQACAELSGDGGDAVRDLGDEGVRDPRRGHVGWYLVGGGRAALEAQLGALPTLRTRLVRWTLRHPHVVYFAPLVAFTAVLLAALATVARMAGAGPGPGLTLVATGLVPAVTVAVAVVHWAMVRMVPARVLPKLEFAEGVPERWRTLVVVPCLFSDPGEVRDLLGKLEVLHQGNGAGAVGFVLLSDFTDAPRVRMPGDEEMLELARDGIRDLNRRHARDGAGPFGLLHRERRWNPGEDRWMGWERKRGKLEQLNRHLLDGDELFDVREGDEEIFRDVRFVCTLDADTRLPPGAAARLAGTLAHPLNRPRVGPAGRVTSGYTVLQPRVETLPTPGGVTWFQRIYEGEVGLDLYSRAVSEVYQDLFGEGIYVGKGLYDLEAFESTLRDRVPENALLSHDLFEGNCGRAGLVSDVVFLEAYPSGVLAYTRRLHRWVRGDWQLLPWLLPRVPVRDGRDRNPFSGLDRWKMVDNLRRSLLAPSLVVLLVAGWLSQTGPAWLWVGIAAAVPAGPIFLGMAAYASRRLSHSGPSPPPAQRPTWSSRLRQGWHRSLEEVARWGLGLVLLLHEALTAGDAIVRTLYRLFVSRRRLLQWTAAAHAERRLRAREGRAASWRRMVPVPLSAAALAGLTAAVAPASLPAALVVCGVWALSPEAAHLSSRPIRDGAKGLGSGDAAFLREVALRTWLFFERHTDSEHHWLPPDHVAANEAEEVAARTSPTNLGMMLVSVVAAYDLGYLGPLGLQAILSNTLESMATLDRHRGHFLNWYSTDERAALEPRYVSTVDSGNLAACLLVVAAAVERVAADPPVRAAHGDGLLDVLRVLDGALGPADRPAVRDDLREVRAWLSALAERIRSGRREPGQLVSLLASVQNAELPSLDRRVARILAGGSDGAGGTAPTGDRTREIRIWSRRVHQHVRDVLREARTFQPWLVRDGAFQAEIHGEDAGEAEDGILPRAPLPLERIPAAAERAMDRLAEPPRGRERSADRSGTARAEREDEAHRLRRELAEAASAARKCRRDLLDLADRARSLAHTMDFGFLYDPGRRLLHIGYRVDAGELDPHHYDLLASEARLASLLAVSRGQVPAEHWLHLRRPFRGFGAVPGLLSWGGTMFEYLLPEHFVRTVPGALLQRSSRVAVDRQIRWGRRHGVPWGVSESAYRTTEEGSAYGYRAFGIPELALRRDPEQRLVISPYASALALPVEPRRSAENLRRLRDTGVYGTYGFFDALDYGPPGEGTGTGSPVRLHMAHHQGMILMALANVLTGGAMRDRFHADPALRAVEHLLAETVPWQAPRRKPWISPEERPGRLPPRPRVREWTVDPRATVPEIQLLADGPLRSVVPAAGGGGLFWKDRAVTRWRPDRPGDGPGQWIYLRDPQTGHLWSPAERPAGGGGETSVHFSPYRVRHRRLARGVSAELRSFLAEGLEVRVVSLADVSERPRTIEVTSFAEISLASPEADRRHPGYEKLFVEASWHEGEQALLLRRRPRGVDEEPIWLGHAARLPRGARLRGWTASREAFLGRHGTWEDPALLRDGADGLRDPGGTGGEDRHSPLDPACALSAEVELPAGRPVELAFLTAVGTGREEVLDRLRNTTLSRIPILADDARRRAREELAEQGIDPGEARLAQQLLSAVHAPGHALRSRDALGREDRLPQSGLWRHGISGDDPIVLVRVGRTRAMTLAKTLTRIHARWWRQGFPVDLVFLDVESSGYARPLLHRLHAMVEAEDGASRIGKEGGVHVLVASEMTDRGRACLAAAAAVVLDTRDGTLEKQLSALRDAPDRLPEFVPVPSSPISREATPDLAPAEGIRFPTRWGGFSPDGGEFVVELDEGPPPAPWANVVATPEMGFVATESALGCTWSGNSGENRLSPWHDDPLRDPPSEVVYARDEETGEVWSLTPLPAGSGAAFRIRHGAGATSYRHRRHGLDQTLRVRCLEEGPVKCAEVVLRDLRNRPRRVTLTYFVEWVLGHHRAGTAAHLLPSWEAEHRILLARNPFHPDYGDRVAFLTADRDPHGVTADRAEFLGASRDPRRPSGLYRIGLSDRVTPGVDPCGAYQVHLDIPAGGEGTVRFFLGQARDREAAVRRVLDARDSGGRGATPDRWDQRLGGVRVETPEPAMDLLLNRWLPYQSLACRLWGRTAVYQSGGAYGFRDQIQDVLALLHQDPAHARAHLLRAAGRQFTEGDVLHWWHPGTRRGVRTRCSDDLLWLPHAVVTYVRFTGDAGILDERAPFLDGPELEPAETERYGEFGEGGEGTLYEHCLRAIDRGSTAGPHGLPLIGSGDWNDGLDRVGIGGRGESVWLGWFLYSVLEDFAPLCDVRAAGRAAELRDRARRLRASMEEAGWDGEWYRRGYYDDGTPLGSRESLEARIDGISQAWGVLSGAARPDRARRAMDAAWEHLVRKEDRLVLLLTPPFDRTDRDPGYIKGYPPGVRENGGQYSHAAAWLGLAFAELGDAERAWTIFDILNPIRRGEGEGALERYRVEPYVQAADVYGAEPHVGRGGWTWYTGSAGWTYRLGLEGILGIRRRGRELEIRPCPPPGWREYTVRYRAGTAEHEIRVELPEERPVRVVEVERDGDPLGGTTIPLEHDGQHRFRVVCEAVPR